MFKMSQFDANFWKKAKGIVKSGDPDGLIRMKDDVFIQG
jgi:hypothetical protein